MKKNQGFSLLELLIVVAIILIIATIAIPSLLRSRQAANESAAVSNLRNLNTAEVAYQSNHIGAYGAVSDLVAAGLIDSRFSTTLSFDYYSAPDYVIRYSTTASRAPSGLTGQPVR